MKLAFSTLGCPNWDLQQIAEAVRRFAYEAVELRALGGDLDLLNRPEFAPAKISETRRYLEDQEIHICCVDTSCTFHSPDKKERLVQIETALRHAELATALGAPLIRVFPDKIQPRSEREETRDNIVTSLQTVADGLPAQVGIGLETHGDFARGSVAAEIVKLANNPKVSLIWDVANSVAAGDSIEETAREVGPYLAHVHLRDAHEVEGSEHWLPVLAGRGNVSFSETFDALEKLEYMGCISFEWEKYWHPEIEDPEVALPDFMKAIKALMAQRQSLN